jgi:hypothetical protein
MKYPLYSPCRLAAPTAFLPLLAASDDVQVKEVSHG